MRRLRMAVWGLGRHAIRRILPAVSAARCVELRGVCSRNEERVSDCIAAWKCRGWTDSAAMLLDSDVDVVYVTTPIGLHAGHGRQVLEAGKHLWGEKPLTARLETTLELLDLSRARGLSVCEAFMYLHHPQFQQLSSYVSGGRLGQPVSVGCCFGVPKLEHPGFRSDPALGGGALLDVGCYPVSALQALFPEARLHVAYSSIGTRSPSAVDTDGQAVIKVSNGVTAQLEWRINCAYRNDIAIWGETASVWTDHIFSKPETYVPVFHVRDAHGADTKERGQAANHFVKMFESFSAIIDSEADMRAERDRIVRRAEVLHQLSEEDGR